MSRPWGMGGEGRLGLTPPPRALERRRTLGGPLLLLWAEGMIE